MAFDEVSIVIRAKDYATKVMTTVGASFGKLQQRIISLRGAMVALGVAFASGRLAQSLIRSFIQQQDAVEGLESALEQTGKTGVAALQLLTKHAAELQKVTRHGDEAIIAATESLTLLAPALNAQELAKAQTAIIGIADTFTKGDLASASQLLGKTLGSTTNALTRYGIQVTASASASEKLNQVLEQSSRFFEVSKEKAKTLGGRLQQLANAFGDVKEAIGEIVAEKLGLTDFLSRTTNIISNIATGLAGDAEQMKEVFAAVGDIIGSAIAGGIVSTMSRIVGKSWLFDARGWFEARAGMAAENIKGAALRLQQIAEDVAASGGGGAAGGGGGGSGGAYRFRARDGIFALGTRGTRYDVSQLLDFNIANRKGAELAKLHIRALEDQARAQEQASRTSEYMATTVINTFAQMAASAIANSRNMLATIVGGAASIAGAAVGIANPAAGAAIAAGGGLLSGILSRGPAPVRVDSYGPTAINQQRDMVQPINFTAILRMDGASDRVIQQRLYQLTRQDASPRILVPIVGGGA